MNVTETSNVGNCDFKFYLHYVNQVALHGVRPNLRMYANLLRTQDLLKLTGVYCRSVYINISKLCLSFSDPMTII